MYAVPPCDPATAVLPPLPADFRPDDLAALPPRDWYPQIVLSAREAEQALDRATRRGFPEQELLALRPGVFLVRWR